MAYRRRGSQESLRFSSQDRPASIGSPLQGTESLHLPELSPKGHEIDPRRSPNFFKPRRHSHTPKHGEISTTQLEAAMEKALGPEDSLESATSLAERHWKMDPNIVCHKGGCHCGAVRYEVYASPTPKVIECNCSICVKKHNRHFIVPQSRFRLLQGHQSLSTYSFNTHKAKHIFCTVCGVQSFFIPRSNSDGYGIVLHCLDSGSITKEKVEKFDGRNWDSEIKKKAHLLNYSKENA